MLKNRRNFIGKSAFGLFGVMPLLGNSLNINLPGLTQKNASLANEDNMHPLYPSTNPLIVKEVVGAAHTQFEKLQKLVDARPELAKATWDWGFGDVESALGAASHMGRKDIAEYLIENGARPNIYTYAMLGKLNAVKAMIEDMPGIQKIHGPHGFTLLFHAQMRIRRDNVKGEEKEEQEALVAYLASLGDADIRDPSLDISADEQKMYLGKYVFGEGKGDFFAVTLNSRGLLFMSRGEYTGRVLLRRDTHSFAPGGAPSVRINFDVTNGGGKDGYCSRSLTHCKSGSKELIPFSQQGSQKVLRYNPKY